MLCCPVAPHKHSLGQLAFTKGGRHQKRLFLRSVRCGGLADFIGGDLLKPDLGRWLEDVEKHKALAVYSPHEGGYEGRYLTRLRYQGYVFLDLSARGLGDPETTLTKIHPVCPPHLGRQPIARWYFPPEVDYRLNLLPPEAKGLVVWIIEAKVLSKAELQFLALLPSLRPKVRVIAECGNCSYCIESKRKNISREKENMSDCHSPSTPSSHGKSERFCNVFSLIKSLCSLQEIKRRQKAYKFQVHPL